MNGRGDRRGEGSSRGSVPLPSPPSASAAEAASRKLLNRSVAARFSSWFKPLKRAGSGGGCGLGGAACGS
eukprot:scaffold45487_cov43-Phaeocystis_antarctica.AAC.1